MKKVLFYKTAILIFIFLLSYPAAVLSQTELEAKVKNLTNRLTYVKEGTILSVNKDIVYINLGQKDNILAGNKFVVVSLGDPIILDGKALGFKETNIGEVEIERVGEKISIAKINKKDCRIEKGDKVYHIQGKIKSIAVTEFNYIRGKNAFTKNLYNMLCTSFIEKGIKVSENNLSGKLLEKEGDLLKLGVTDTVKASVIGKSLGVNWVITGNISDMGDSILIMARLVNVKQGLVVNGSGVQVKRTDEITELLCKSSIEVSIGQNVTKRKETVQKVKPKKKLNFMESMLRLLEKPAKSGKFFEVDDVCITIKSFKRKKDTIYMNLIYENLADHNIAAKIRDTDSIYLIDENNEKWKFSDDTAGVYRWGKAILRNGKMSTDVTFIPSGDSAGQVFTLYISHSRPISFDMIIYDLIPEPPPSI